MTNQISKLNPDLLACIFSFLTPEDLAKNQRTCKALDGHAQKLFAAMLRGHTTLRCTQGTQRCLEGYQVVHLQQQERQRLGKPGSFINPAGRLSFTFLLEKMSSLTHLSLIYTNSRYSEISLSEMIAYTLRNQLKKGSKITSLEVEPLFEGHPRSKDFISQILDAGTNLTSLSFRCDREEQEVDDETISQLVIKCPKLEALTIHDGQITDQSLHLLPRLLALRTLNLRDSQKITPKGIEVLKFNTSVQVSCLPAPK